MAKVLLFVPQSGGTIIESEDGIMGGLAGFGVQTSQLLAVGERGKGLALHRRLAGAGCGQEYGGRLD
ncbi:hypothetical protein JX265_010224 [Neoarthrinium moseri]|uniref:Uncharacterized protein n=1 Tax=Neoarthrinium moseri TaxID=1658444 RepID=A0A9P9WEB9_9PEZI|nr:hypothetical protein JX265_010224 [Neoarthrinium moseri]